MAGVGQGGARSGRAGERGQHGGAPRAARSRSSFAWASAFPRMATFGERGSKPFPRRATSRHADRQPKSLVRTMEASGARGQAEADGRRAADAFARHHGPPLPLPTRGQAPSAQQPDYAPERSALAHLTRRLAWGAQAWSRYGAGWMACSRRRPHRRRSRRPPRIRHIGQAGQAHVRPGSGRRDRRGRVELPVQVRGRLGRGRARIPGRRASVFAHEPDGHVTTASQSGARAPAGRARTGRWPSRT